MVPLSRFTCGTWPFVINGVTNDDKSIQGALNTAKGVLKSLGINNNKLYTHPSPECKFRGYYVHITCPVKLTHDQFMIAWVISSFRSLECTCNWKLIGDLISDQQSSQTQEHLVLELTDCTIHELTLNNWFLFVWNPVCMICSQLHVVKLCCVLGKWSYCTSERPWDWIKAFPRFPIIISIHVLLNHLFCRTAMLECMSRWIL